MSLMKKAFYSPVSNLTILLHHGYHHAIVTELEGDGFIFIFYLFCLEQKDVQGR